MTPTALCIIPARGGSTRIPGKNMKPFHGKPILWYSMLAAHSSELFVEIVVSSDSAETLAYAASLEMQPHSRPDHLALNEVGTQEVAANVLADFGTSFKPDLVCVIYATAPLMSIADLKRGRQLLLDFPSLEFAYSIGCENERQVDAGQFYWCRAKSLLEGRQLDQAPTGHVMIHPSRLCDINTPEDFERAERMFLELEENR